MRVIALLVVCAGLLLTAAGCDPATDRRYFTEGAGVDLYTADRANQVELLNQYIKFICGQAGPDCGGSWSVFVQAGMNDIDLRCDGFLTWLDARRRDKEPILSELSALNTAAHTIMTVSGVGPKALDIVTAAFGLATATYTNWNSRLLIAVNQSTVQDVVYTSQGQYREKTKNYPVNDQPTAIYLLRNYLRLCMPTTIEANINTSSTLVQSGNPMSAMHSTVVKSVTRTPVVRVRGTFTIDDPGEALKKYLYPNGVSQGRNPEHAKMVQAYLDKNHITVHILAFLRDGTFAEHRLKLARELKLIP
jgi:hypothetical protein